MKKHFLLTLAFVSSAALAQSNFKVGMVYDAGGKFDKSFNQSAYEGSQRAIKELNITTTDYEAPQRTAIPSQLQKFADEKYNIVFGVGYGNNADITNAANKNPNTKFALIDDLSSNKTNVASILFREEEGSFLACYIAANTTQTGVIGFVGGQTIDLIYKFAAGCKAGVIASGKPVKVISRYVGNTDSAWNDPTTAYRQAGELRAAGADIIFAAAGQSGLGVINYIKDKQCMTQAELPAGMKFRSNQFANLPKSESYKKACGANTRPMFFIGVDSNQNYLGDFDKNPATMNHGLTSMLKRVDNAVYAVIRTTQANQWRGGELRFGLKEGGVGYALDEYNKALIPRELINKVDSIKNRIIRGLQIAPGLNKIPVR